ncbi:MAG: fibronectin type III domain-containing protein [Rhodospirillaceae bacterium]|nr:fibronectin type III domain-containing protein [Rhodospirillaceae bacterium]MDD9997094.1 fibronectin type III domain-containing protein [Rhodospirillaceae bacterium]MDE0359549.1 fibronectin type III domain-containing protein [Rhodospirillaceae bacterium]
MATQKQPSPRIQWDGTTWAVSLPLQDGNVIDASWNPGLTYVVRIRDAARDKAWSFGFETPLTHISFVDLKPDTEYEVQVCAKNAAGEGEPQLFRIRTSPTGHTDNVIPFPKR